VGDYCAGEAGKLSELRVGLAGLGRMGVPMARNLARAGLLVGAYNRTRSVADKLAGEVGVESCGTPAELAGIADVVITMVADEQASMQLYAGAGGFLEAIHPETIALEMSTVSIGHVKTLSGLLKARGANLLDVPVSGSVAMAESATLTLLVGGPEAVSERIEPVLRVLGSTIFHLGPLGSGAAMKLAVNTVVYGLNGALSEGLVLAERTGIPRERAYEVFVASAIAAPFVHYRRAAFERPGETPVALRLPLAEKDLDLILKLAEELGHPMPQAELNAEILRSAAEAGFAEADVSAVAEYLRRDGTGSGPASTEDLQRSRG
jgi:3-hydroxyisobutyrate dehydrogenase-like beta-hydroxyacid dehydrogenase